MNYWDNLTKFECYVIGNYWLHLLGSLLFGFFLWPIFEYAAHRWIFHLKPPENWPFLISLHFGLHGLHHKVSSHKYRVRLKSYDSLTILF